MSLITEDVKDLIHEALGKELYASFLYRQFSLVMQRMGYFGASAFFEREAKDEVEHFKIWTDYVNDRGDMIDVPGVETITERPKSLKDALQSAYDTEKELGEFYAEMYEKCEDGGDCTTGIRVQKFIKIQTQSVGEYGDLLAFANVCGDDKAALLMLDSKMNG